LHSCSLASTSVHWGIVNLQLTDELSWELFKMDRKWVRYELVFNGSVCSVWVILPYSNFELYSYTKHAKQMRSLQWMLIKFSALAT
jgi:hypothetical protein